MAANNSTLQIEVVSQGIADTVRKLDLLGNAAGRNEAKVKLLTDSLGKLMVAQNSAVASAAQHANLMNVIAQSMGMVANSATATAKQVAALNANLAALNTTSNQTTNAFHRKSSAGHVVNATIRAMTTAALAYLGINFAKGIVEAADGWKMMQARLKLATGSMEEAKAVQGDLFNMAQRLRVPLDDAAKLYTRMAVPMQRMGKDAKQTAEQVEFVSLALKLNGATAGEASSVMLQYSQSVNAGRLNGAEFNAVAEGAPGILRAIEAELKSTGKWSEHSGKTLKQMGADGEITFELMSRAAQRALPEMRKAFEELPLTVDGAIQRVKNAWYKAMGEMGEKTDMGVKLAKAVGQLEASIPAIRDALAGAFLFLHDNFGMIVAAVQTILTIKFIGWIGSATAALIGMAQAVPAIVTGMAATATGAAGATTAVGALRLAASALAGPWGILIGLVGTAAVAAWQHFGKEAPKADAAVTASTRVEVVDRIKLIQKEIDKINERNGALGAKPPAAYEVTANDREQVALITQINGLKSTQAGMTNAAAKAGVQVTLDMLDLKLKTIQGQQTVLDSLKKVNEDAAKKDKADGWLAKFNQKNESKAEEFARKLADAKKEAAEFGVEWTKSLEAKLKFEVLGKNLGGPAPDKVDHFEKLRASIAAATAELKLNIATGDKASAAEKLRASFSTGDNKDYNLLSPTSKSKIDAMVAENIALEGHIELINRRNKATVEAAQEDDKHTKNMQAGIVTIMDETLRTRAQIAALTETRAAVKELAAAQMEADAAAAEAMAIRQMDKNGDMAKYDLYMAQARALRDLAGARRELGEGQDKKIAFDELDKLLDPKKALNFGDSLSEAFGKAGGSIGKMSKALGVYGKAQEKIDDQRKLLLSLKPDEKRAAGLKELNHEETQAQLKAYGDMAGGAKEFFSEHTAGYKVLSAAEKAFRIAEVAGAIANFVTKSGLVTAFTGLFATAKATESGIQAGATGVSVAAAGTEASAWGVTAVVKAIASLPFPLNLAAGAATLAAVVAIGASMMGSVGGGGASGADELKAKQKRQGIGTVLGDEAAKSASLANSMEVLRENSNIGLVYSSNMLLSLRNIEASMSGLTAAIARVSGMTTGKNFGIETGTNSGGGLFGSGFFASKTTRTIQDTGLTIQGNVNDFKNGSGVQQYVDVQEEKKKWYGSTKTSNYRQMQGVDDDVTKTIGRVFDEINNSIVTAATALGRNGESIRTALEAYVINTEVSFKDLTGEELQQALNDVFSGAADGMARAVFPGLELFQTIGEGYYQTIVRVATGSEQAGNALKSFGIQMVNIDLVANKTGDIAAELFRASVLTKEFGTSIADIMKLMDGSISDLIDGYKSLLAIQDTMRATSLGNSVSMDTIRGAGGLPELESALSDFTDGFYSDSERQAIALYKLRAQFGRLNLTMPETKEGFRALVESLMNGSAASKELAGRVLMLGSDFADAFSDAEEARKDAIDKAKDNLSDAYDKEADALDNIIDKMKGFRDSLADFKSTLIIGDLSTKSSSEKYATAKAQYDATYELAKTGDEVALKDFEKAASEYLKLSREVNASGLNYTADYERVLRETEELRAFTSTQVDVATASLDALNLQVKGLIKIDESILSVVDAIHALQTLMDSPIIDGSHAGGLASVPFDGYIAELHKGETVLTASQSNSYRQGPVIASGASDEALINEIKSLREELKQLKEEQREQTSYMIAANYDSNERNAQAVVDGTKSAMEDAAYVERTKTGLV